MKREVMFCQLCEGIVSDYNDENISTCASCHLFLENSPYVELKLRRKDGKRIAVTASSTLVPGSDGVPPCSILAIRDISEQKQQAQKRISRQLTNKMMQTLEEERKRVSQELHDGIGQSMFSIQLTLNMMRDQFRTSELAETYDNLSQMVSQVLDEVRHISTDLRPSILDDLGLVPAIRSYLKRIKTSVPFELHFTFNRHARLKPDAEIALYRIFQEALSNAIKYAEAENFTVDLFFGRGSHSKVRMTLLDDGKGFLPGEIGDNGIGLGHFSMKERVASLHGTIRIDSMVGTGTRIEVTLPQEGDDDGASGSHLDR